MRKILTNPIALLRVLVVILVSLLMSFGNNTYAATTLKDCVRVDISSNDPRTSECTTLMSAASSDQIDALVDEIMLSRNNENTGAETTSGSNPTGAPAGSNTIGSNTTGAPAGTNADTGSESRGDISYSLQNPLAFDSIQDFITAILKVVIVIATPIVVFFIILAGFKYVTARGNATEIQNATRALTHAIIGGVLIIGAVAISEIIKNLVTAFAG